MTGKPLEPVELRCWCNNTKLHKYSEFYSLCRQCNTLISNYIRSEDYYKGSDSIDSLYGKDYWTRHVKETYGFPDIFERARNDLAERDIYWLRTILKYKLPPARTLELGCAHGGSVFLMQMAGFEAEGAEMSPWLCDFANMTFGIPMHCGPIEDASLQAESLDLIIMMDVLEHMPNPVQSLQKIISLLSKDGILVIQAPWWRLTEKSYEDMKKDDELFLLHLKEQEHLYLFSESSVKKLLKLVGFNDIRFEDAIFPHDMFVFASKNNLSCHNDVEVSTKLTESSNGRMALALLDVYTNMRDLNCQNTELIRKCTELENEICKMQTLVGVDSKRSPCLNDEIVSLYENSLSWKITKPFRYIHSKLFG